MSMRNPERLDCPKCRNIQTVDVWRSLNATINPEARNDLFEGKINIFHSYRVVLRRTSLYL